MKSKGGKKSMSDYNLRGIISLWSNETKSRLSINAWLGRIYFTVFFENNTKPYSITINENSLFLVEKFITDMFLAEPSKQKSILLSEYDRIENKFSLKSTITIGKDDKSIIFMEITDTNFPSADNKVRFSFLLPNSVSIDDPDIANLTEGLKSESSARAFISSLKDLAIARIISRDRVDMEQSLEDFKKKREASSGNGGNGGNGGNESPATSASTGTDIPF